MRSSDHHEQPGIPDPQSRQDTKILTNSIVASVEMNGIFLTERFVQCLRIIFPVIVRVGNEEIIAEHSIYDASWSSDNALTDFSPKASGGNWDPGQRFLS